MIIKYRTLLKQILIICFIACFVQLFICADTNILQSGCEYDYQPYCFSDEDSNATGFSIELLDTVASIMDMKVNYRMDYWYQLKKGLAEGDLDVLPLVGRTKEREEIYDFTIPYLPMHGVIVVRIDEKSIKSLEDLQNKTIAVMEGDNAEEFIRRQCFDCNIVTTKTFSEALTALNGGTYDAVIMQHLLAVQLIDELHLDNIHTIMPILKEFRQDFCLAVKKGNHELLNELNEGLAITINNGVFRHLYTKWFFPIEAGMSNAITVGMDSNYPPWEFIDENGHPAGFNVDITKAIARELNLNIIFYAGDWADMQTMLQRGDIDVIQGMFYSLNRAVYNDFTTPYINASQIVVTRKHDSVVIDSEEDLKNMTVLVQKADIMHEYAEELGIEHIITYETTEAALSDLVDCKGDCALLNRIQAMYLIKKNRWNELALGIHLRDHEYCYAVYKDNNHMLTIFDEGLNIIRQSNEYRHIKSKWFSTYESFLITPLIRIIGIFITIGIIALTIVITWNYLLKKRIERAKGELKRTEENYSELYSTMAQGVVYYSRNGHMIEANPAAEHILGISKKDMISKSKPFRAIDANGNDLPYDQHPAEISMRKGSIVTDFIMGVYNYEKMDYVWIIINAKPLFKMGESEPYQVYTTFQDITELRKAQLELSKMDRLSSLGQLAGGIAHDYNNILTVILGNISLIEQETDNEDIVHYTQDAINAVETARDLTHQLITFASGGEPLLQIFPIRDILRDVGDFCIHGSNSLILYNIEDDLWNAEIDPSQIKQVIQNIIINAVQAMPDGGEIIISAYNKYIDNNDMNLPDGHYISIEIADNGIGINTNIMNRIFDPYFTTKQYGNGLGLAMASSIIKRHYGHIDVNSEINKGTTFTILLPATEKEAENKDKTVNNDVFSAVKQGNILVMDDEIMIRKLAGKILGKAGYTVVTAENGEDAVCLYKEAYNADNAFDCVILDLTIPGGMGGREASEHILAINSNAKLIVSSGYSEDGIMSDYSIYGFSNAIVKPYHIEELLDTVNRTIGDIQ